MDDEPKEYVRDGLVVVFDRDTKYETRFAFVNIQEGQKEYPLPFAEERTIVGVYLKVYGGATVQN